MNFIMQIIGTNWLNCQNIGQKLGNMSYIS